MGMPSPTKHTVCHHMSFSYPRRFALIMMSFFIVTLQEGALLCFDEVMTGFRIARGGAQEHFGIRPDLTTLGKVIGGGLPVGAYGGRRDIIEMVAPSGPVYQAGTLSGNPLAMAAGIATLKILDRPGTSFCMCQLL